MAEPADEVIGDEAVARRNFLRKLLGGGAVAAAGAAGATALLAEPAGAGPSALLLNQANANLAGAETSLSGTPDSLGESTFKVTQGGTTAGAAAVTATSDANATVGVTASSVSGAPLRVIPNGSIAMPPATGNWTAGSMRVDDNGDIWYCWGDGAGANSGWYPLSLIPAFVPLAAPQRVYDSRPGFPPTNVPKGKLSPNQERNVDPYFNPTTISPFAFALLMNLTVGDTVGGGFLSVFSDDVTWPGTSSINWYGSDQVFANNATTVIGETSGEFTVRCGGTGPTNFVVDIVGYYTVQ